MVPLKMTPMALVPWDLAVLSNSSSMEGIQCSRFGAFSSETPIVCQFTFTCDGALARTPMEPYWSRAKEVAEASLDGFVARSVGPAVSYHADHACLDTTY